jgi:hypothetical protein
MEEDGLTLEQIATLFEFNKRLEAIESGHIEVVRLVIGDSSLNVPSLRDKVATLELALENQQTFIDRLKWVLSTLGLTNTGTIIALLSELLQ